MRFMNVYDRAGADLRNRRHNVLVWIQPQSSNARHRELCLDVALLLLRLELWSHHARPREVKERVSLRPNSKSAHRESLEHCRFAQRFRGMYARQEDWD